MFPIEKYHFATSIDDAIASLDADEKARVIAGGTDVLVRLHGGNPDYDHLVDINGLGELKKIYMDSHGNIYIGTLATCSEIISHELIRQHLPMVVQSLETIGGPQVRNAATMGGNICNGAVSADSACAALIYEMDLLIRNSRGERVQSINGFHTGPGRTVLKQGDLFTFFRIRPEQYRNMGASYCKYAMRGAMDIATIGCGVAIKMNGAKVDTLKLAFTVAAPTPIRCPTAEKTMEGATISEKSLERLADAVEGDVKPRTSWRASKEFRLHIIRTLAKRVTLQALDNQGGAC